MIDSPHGQSVPLSPLAESALGQATDLEAAEFMKRTREQKQFTRKVEHIAEGPSGLFQETIRTLTGAD